MKDAELGTAVFLETKDWVAIGLELTGLGGGGVFAWSS